MRLLEEIQAAGYTGGYTQLKEFVRKIRPVETEPLIRFETEAGHLGAGRLHRFRAGPGQAAVSSSATRSWWSSVTPGCCV